MFLLFISQINGPKIIFSSKILLSFTLDITMFSAKHEKGKEELKIDTTEPAQNGSILFNKILSCF